MGARYLATTIILILATAVSSVAGLTPNLWFNVTLNPTSGIVQSEMTSHMTYGPDWECIGKGGNASSQWSMVLRFFGRDLYLYGDIQNGGGEPVTAHFGNISPINAISGIANIVSGLFMKFTSISLNSHLITQLDPSNDDVDMTLRSLTVTTGMVTQAPTFEDVTRYTEYFVVDNQLNPNVTIKPKPGMVAKPVQKQQSASDPTFYNILSGDTALPWDNDNVTHFSFEYPSLIVDFAVPRNTSFFILNGTVSPNGYGGMISASPTPDYWTQYFWNGDTINTIWFSTLKAKASNPSEEIANEVLFYAPLDPAVDYRLKVETWGGAVGLHSITYFSNDYIPTETASSTPSNTPSAANATDTTQDSNAHHGAVSKAPIIGGVVGGVLGGALLASLLWFAVSRYRRHRRKSTMDNDVEFEVDHSAGATPFQDDSSATQLMGALAVPMNEMKRGAQPIPKTTPAYGLYRPASASASDTTNTAQVTSSASPGVGVGSSRGSSPPPIVVAERDAGGIQRFEYVPPQYDPQWAANHHTPLSDGSSNPSAPTVVSSSAPGSHASARSEAGAPSWPLDQKR